MNYYSDYGKRGVLQIAMGYAGLWCGGLARFAPPACWQQVERLVFVCKGNICRSAYAEAAARRLGFAAASFGLEAGAGSKPANPEAAEVALRHGLDLSMHRTTGPQGMQLAPGDLLACMEVGQARRCEVLFPGQPVMLLGLLIGKPNIMDPYGRSPQVFERELMNIRSALAAAARLSKLAPASGNVADNGRSEQPGGPDR